MGKIFEVITRELMVLLVAAMPLAELRGAIPLGVSLGMHPLHATLLGVLGSLIPVPFLLFFLKPVVLFFRDLKPCKNLVNRILRRTIKKSDKIKRYSALGLVLFVAIPLPTTGVWSGCLAATIFNIPIKIAFPAIALGTVVAGSIMFTLSYVITSI